MLQPSYPLKLADWCLPFNKNLPKEITTHFIDLLVKWYDMWDFQLNDGMAQQSYEDPPLLDLVEILNVSSKDGGVSLLNISLKEVPAAGVVEETAVGDDEISRVLGS